MATATITLTMSPAAHEAMKVINDEVTNFFKIPSAATIGRMLCSAGIALYCLFYLDDTGSPWTATWLHFHLAISSTVLPVFFTGQHFPKTRIFLALFIMTAIGLQNVLILTGPLILWWGAGDATLWFILIWLNKAVPLISALLLCRKCIKQQ